MQADEINAELAAIADEVQAAIGTEMLNQEATAAANGGGNRPSCESEVSCY